MNPICEALAPGTLASYNTGVKAFLAYVASAGILDFLPPDEPLLLAFVTFQADLLKTTHGSIKSYLKAIKHLCRSAGASVDAFDGAQWPRGGRAQPEPL